MGKGSDRRKRQKREHIFKNEVEPALKVPGMPEYLFDPVLAKKLSEAQKSEVLKLKGKLLDPTSNKLFNPKDRREAVKSSKRALDTAASQPPTGYYVIIGRGLAAVLNHTTLRQTPDGQARLQGVNGNPLPVLHIGLPDPWASYHAHGMGQPWYLLRLPGFHFRPTAGDQQIRSGLHSRDFADKTRREWNLLKSKYGFPQMEGWVAVIQQRGQEAAAWVPTAEWGEFPGLRGNIAARWTDAWPAAAHLRYRLIVVLPDETLKYVYAEKVDICCGLGRASVQAAAPHHTVDATAPAPMLQEMRAAAPLLWRPPYMWDAATRDRAILTGPEALFEQTNWDATHRIYVNGGGGIGLNMIERAEDEGCFADWLHYRTLHGTFNLERNDTVLKDPGTGGPRLPGTSGLRAPDGEILNPMPANLQNLIPCDQKWRFGRNATLPTYTGVDRVGAELRVTINANPNARIHDYNDNQASAGEALNAGAFPFSPYYDGAQPGLATAWGTFGRYNRVLCTGGQNGNSLGAAMQLSNGFVFQALNKKGRVVAIETADQNIRILGAATFGYPNFPALVGGGGVNPTRTYFESLPISAVPPGFIFSGINIAEANGWFDAAPNTNVNTATRDELFDFFYQNGAAAIVANRIARAIVELRRRVNGFSSPADIIAKFQAEAVNPVPLPSVLAAMGIGGWQGIVGTALTDYRPADPLL